MQKLLAFMVVSFLVFGIMLHAPLVIAEEGSSNIGVRASVSTSSGSGDSGDNDSEEDEKSDDSDEAEKDCYDSKLGKFVPCEDLEENDDMDNDREESRQKTRENIQEMREKVREILEENNCTIKVERRSEVKDGKRVTVLKKKIRCNNAESELEVENSTREGYKERIRYKFMDKDLEVDAEEGIDLVEEVNGTDYELKARIRGTVTNIKVMPHQASEVALERLRANNFTVELRDIGDRNIPRVVYHIEANKTGRFLGVFKLALKADTDVDPETGEIISFNKPWWAFLVAGEDSQEEQTISGNGVVKFQDIEGGCWLIVSNNVTYEPTNLEDEFKEDGLEVTFEAEVNAEAVSICQAGTLIELKSMTSLFENGNNVTETVVANSSDAEELNDSDAAAV